MKEKPICPECDDKEPIKSGHVQGKQRFKCEIGNFQLTALVPGAYPPETEARVIELYNHGLSVGTAPKLQGISRTSSLNRINEFAKKYMRSLLLALPPL